MQRTRVIKARPTSATCSSVYEPSLKIPAPINEMVAIVKSELIERLFLSVARISRVPRVDNARDENAITMRKPFLPRASSLMC